jgi:hypothetical protein
MADRMLYIPDFLEAELQSQDDLTVIRDCLQGKNWLTKGLVDEIIQMFPKSDDIDPTTGERDQTKFSESCSKLFPLDRMFASEKQVEQAASMFLDAWAVVKAHNGKKIICHYGLNTQKNAQSSVYFPLPSESMSPQRQRSNARLRLPIPIREEKLV